MAFLSSEQRKYRTLSQLTFYEPSPFPPSFATPPWGARLGPGGENPGDNVFNEPSFASQNNQLPEFHSNAGFLLVQEDPSKEILHQVLSDQLRNQNAFKCYLQNQMKGKIVNCFSTRIV